MPPGVEHFVQIMLAQSLPVYPQSPLMPPGVELRPDWESRREALRASGPLVDLDW